MRKRYWNQEDFNGCLGLSLIGIAVFLFLIVSLINACGGLNIEVSEGYRSGVVQKISKKGILYKTWEGECNLGYNTSVKDSDGHNQIVPAVFYFSTESDQVAQSLKYAELSGKRVTLNYKQYWMRGWDKGKTGYDITGVEIDNAKMEVKKP